MLDGLSVDKLFNESINLPQKGVFETCYSKKKKFDIFIYFSPMLIYHYNLKVNGQCIHFV